MCFNVLVKNLLVSCIKNLVFKVAYILLDRSIVSTTVTVTATVTASCPRHSWSHILWPLDQPRTKHRFFCIRCRESDIHWQEQMHLSLLSKVLKQTVSF